MAFISSSIVANPPLSFAERISAVFERLVAFGEAHYNSSARAQRIAKLEALSDEELAARGIKREMIAYHVYRDCVAY